MHPIHVTALQYADAGCPVFPLRVGGKAPVTAHSFKDRTTDVDQINAWWGEADYNLGIVPDDLGCYVVDLDGADGTRSWAELCRANGTPPPTLTVRTPSGGWHLWFAGSLRPSAGKLGKGVDIRSQGSYVLVPPSIVDGRQYTLVGSPIEE